MDRAVAHWHVPAREPEPSGLPRQAGPLIDLHIEERGQGPPLLLIPGVPAIAGDWAPLAEPLSARRRVIAFDNRGSGRSPVTPGPYSTRQLAEDAAALLDRLAIERADVMGMSLGGMVAQELALGWPERVDRLILGCTHAGIRHAARPPDETARAFTLDTESWAERMRVLAPLAFAASADQALVEGFVAKKSGEPQDPEGYRGQIAAAVGHDAFDRLPRISQRTLVITGDDDRVIPGESSRPLANGIPDATLIEVTGAGHLFFLEQPDATLGAIERFLDDRP